MELPGAMWVKANTTNDVYYMLKDHIGSASVVTDANDDLEGEHRYYLSPQRHLRYASTFGETRFSSGSLFTDKLFTGQRQMAGLGIYHYNARFYSPKLGRFLSADTIVPDYADPQTLNRYSYVINNPLRYTDPTGHAMATGDGGGKPKKPCPSCAKAVQQKLKKAKEKEKPIQSSTYTRATLPTSTATATPTSTPAPILPINPLVTSSTPSIECTSTHPCIGPKPKDPWWWDLDPRNPDYFVLSLSGGPPLLPGFTTTLTVDRYKNIYWGVGGNYGKSLEAASGSLNGGSIGSPFDNEIPDPVNIQSFLTGLAINGGGGAVGGGGVTYSPGASKPFVSKWAVEYGGILPAAAGISVVKSWKIFDPFWLGD